VRASKRFLSGAGAAEWRRMPFSYRHTVGET
jgi:hypothetical protein